MKKSQKLIKITIPIVVAIFACLLLVFGKTEAGDAKLADNASCGDQVQCANNCASGYGISGGGVGTNLICGPTSVQTGGFGYRLLESFPGFYSQGETMTDFPALILAIYKFGIWTVGIAGLFMLIIGGFMYMGSAGNNATVTTAKRIITDALFGVVAAMGAYLFMYVINPDLTKIDIAFTKVNVDNIEGTPMGPPDTVGNCKPVSSGECSIERLTAYNKTGNPVKWATQASSICNGESGGGASVESGVDRCRGNGTNDPVSIGLFQINLSVHRVAGLNCPKAFNVPYTAKIAKDRTKCWVTDRTLYNKCVEAAKNPANNIATAWQIYSQRSSWRPWGANRLSNCNFP